MVEREIIFNRKNPYLASIPGPPDYPCHLTRTMFSHWIVCALLSLQLQVKATSASSSSLPCMETVHQDTISFFSHVPLTFSFEVPSAPDCANKCAGLASCHTWLYSTSGRECQLYRDQPLSQAPNPLFVSGSCGSPSPSSSTVSASVSPCMILTESHLLYLGYLADAHTHRSINNRRRALGLSTTALFISSTVTAGTIITDETKGKTI